MIAILGFLTTITTVAFSNVAKKESVEKDAMMIVSLLDQARSLTLSSKDDTQYGVHFSSSTVTLFEGATYDSNNPDNQSFDLSARTELSTIAFSPAGSEVVFARLTGRANRFGTTTVSLKADASTAKSVVLFSTGVVEMR